MPRLPSHAHRKLPRRVLSFALGTLLTFGLLELSLSVAYRTFAWVQASRNATSGPAGEHEIRIVCVGESTTSVAGDETGSMLVARTSYPAQLETILNARQSTHTFRVLNNGIMAGTTESALELLRMTLESSNPQKRVGAGLGLVADVDQLQHTPSLKRNYAQLYSLAEQHGATLIIMQYPAFDLDSLHLYAPESPGVVFIDNLHVFDANPEGYFFEPTFPNSFSHYTQRWLRPHPKGF